MPDNAGVWLPALRPAERIDGDGVVLRRWTVEDAGVMHSLVTANIDHLRPWMPWIAHEPLTEDDRRSLLAEWDMSWDAGTDCAFMVERDGVPVGSAGLHSRKGSGVLEIGYWVSAAATGRGVATAAAKALARHALAMRDVHAVEIHHDSANIASGRVAEKAGFAQVLTYRREVTAPGESGVTVRWVLSRQAR
jgi:RimJ/RimL family protein N-acetyltransferase